MDRNRNNFCYQVGGSLASESSCYVERNADREIESALEQGQFCYVLNSRQMGKSSLRIRAMTKLQAQQTVCIFIDLTGMGTQDLTPEKWYAGIVRSIVSSCQLKLNWRKWWRDKRDLFNPVQRLNLFIEEVLLVEVTGKIAIFVDEIDRVLSQDFSLDDFFALIHSCYQKRQVNPDYSRLTFTLLGVAAPRDLIRDRTQSPFDAGRAIALEGFKGREALPLISGLIERPGDPQQTLREILDWTGGQPFLTQKLCQLVREEANNSKSVAEIIGRDIITNWESQDEPEHLRTIRDRLCYRDSSKTIRLLGLYRQILQQGKFTVDRSPEQTELRLSGLVVARQGNLEVNNRIYGQIFDLAWVDDQLAQLRPYSVAIANWEGRNCNDDRYLLRGQELQSALTWSLNKSLADIDYQFLVKSQNLAKQKVQDALTAVETASELLAEARKQARQRANKQRLSKKWLGAIAFGTTGLMILLRYTGILQSWEWNLLDRFFRWRLTDNIEPYITVITVDEGDIKQVGQWPIPDGTIATAIKNIELHQPQAIALDIYRDLPVKPGTQELLQVFNSNSHIYAVEKVIGDPVPPPEIPPQQVGFSDQTIDGDGKIRRALLSVVGDDKRTRFSLGTQAALDYLKEENIELKAIDRQRYGLGRAIFERFDRSDGGYVRADSGGYQILLNYWGTKANFQQYSLTQVLRKEIATADISDRLIFIGSTAESIKDSFYTPYTKGWFRSPPKMPGVFIQANIASQIINAAIDNRPLLRTHNQTNESLWILFWGVIGIIVWRVGHIWLVLLAISLISVLLLIGCYLTFLLGWWLPLIPSWLTLWATTITAIVIKNKQRDRAKFQHTLDFLLADYGNRPLVSKIALEYLKRSQNQANQNFIDEKIKNKTKH